MNTLLTVWIILVHTALAALVFVVWKLHSANKKLTYFLNGYVPPRISPFAALGLLAVGFIGASLLNDKREFKEIDPLPPIGKGEE